MVPELLLHFKVSYALMQRLPGVIFSQQALMEICHGSSEDVDTALDGAFFDMTDCFVNLNTMHNFCQHIFTFFL